MVPYRWRNCRSRRQRVLFMGWLHSERAGQGPGESIRDQVFRWRTDLDGDFAGCFQFASGLFRLWLWMGISWAGNRHDVGRGWAALCAVEFWHRGWRPGAYVLLDF